MLKALKKLIPKPIVRIKNLIAKRGDRYYCPFCGYRANELSPVGYDFPVLRERQVVGSGRRNGGCYKCLSSDRERLIFAYLKEKTDMLGSNKDLSVLHIAPEENLSKLLGKHGFREYICGDLFAPGYVYPKHVQNIDVAAIPFEDDRFDLVICNHVLEHVPDDRRAIREIRRVLKPGGRAILQVPISTKFNETIEDPSVTDPRERERRFGQHDHIRIYGQDYTERLKEAGFNVSVLDLSQEFSKYGSNPDEKIFVCRK